MDDNQIRKILASYEKNKIYKRNYYNKRYAEDSVYRDKKIKLSREHYANTQTERKEKYDHNKDRINAERRWRHAQKKPELIERYKTKYASDYESFIKNIHD
jgi:hypothetical protein